jgi:hypothetical protein
MEYFTSLGTARNLLVSFMHQLPYTWGNSPWYPMDTRLGGPHSFCAHSRKEQNPYPCHVTNTGDPAKNQYLYWLLPTLIQAKYNYYEAYFMNEHGNALILCFHGQTLLLHNMTQTTEITTGNGIILHPSLALWKFTLQNFALMHNDNLCFLL